MKLLWFTDLHLHNFKPFDNNSSRLNNGLNVIERLYLYASEKGIDTILFSGDMFEAQKALPVVVINKTSELFSRLNKIYPYINFISISGNHDQSTVNITGKPAETSLTYLKYVNDNFHLIDNDIYQCKDKKTVICGIPYYEYKEHFEDALNKMTYTTLPQSVPDYEKKDVYILIHQTPSGLNTELSHLPVDIESNHYTFEPYKLILNGHIHKSHVIGKMIVGGNPIQKNFSDEGESKGFWVIDTQDNTYEFIDLTANYPEFLSIYEDDTPPKGNYYIRKVPKEIPLKDEETNNSLFDLKNTDKEIVTSFFNRVTDGSDKQLLETGLSFLQ